MKTYIEELTVHPAADLFPMMSDEELQDLAEDIQTNGQAFPIVMDGAVLIDGRNRLAACKLAGVEPTFEQLNGRDPLAFIVSANTKRRNLTKGQLAMSVAMVYPEPEKGGRGKNVAARKAADSAGFSSRRLAEAREILRHSPELAKSVVAGDTPFDQALKAAEAEKQQVKGDAAKMNRLRQSAPDLAEMVDEGRMSLTQAIGEFNQRQSRLLATYQDGINAAERITDFCGQVLTILEGEKAQTSIRDAESAPPIQVKAKAIKQIEEAVAVLRDFARRTNAGN